MGSNSTLPLTITLTPFKSVEEAMYHLRDFCHNLSAHHDLHYDQYHDKIFEAKKHCRKQEGSKLECYRCQEKHPRDRMFDTPRNPFSRENLYSPRFVPFPPLTLPLVIIFAAFFKKNSGKFL